jgi:hypothetical protein
MKYQKGDLIRFQSHYMNDEEKGLFLVIDSHKTQGYYCYCLKNGQPTKQLEGTRGYLPYSLPYEKFEI